MYWKSFSLGADRNMEKVLLTTARPQVYTIRLWEPIPFTLGGSTAGVYRPVMAAVWLRFPVARTGMHSAAKVQYVPDAREVRLPEVLHSLVSG
jgi:hypothetical protein